MAYSTVKETGTIRVNVVTMRNLVVSVNPPHNKSE